MSKILKFTSVFSLSLLAAACGGGSGSTTSSDASKPSTLSGAVIDGYIKGAKVCLDVNSNLSCDADEPFAMTVDGGAYSFAYSGNVDGMQVVAEIPTGAIDSDLGAITSAYSMLSPASDPSVITPLTTLVSVEMLSNGSTREEAQNSIKTSLSLPSNMDLLGYDFKKANDSNTTAIAQITAAAIAKTSELVASEAASATAKYRLKYAFNKVKDEILPVVISSNGTVTISNATDQASVIASLNSKVTISVSGALEDINVSTKSGNGKVADIAEIFNTSGLVLAYTESGDYLNSNNQRVNGSYGGFENALAVEWLKNFTTFIDTQRVLVDGNWYKKYEGNEKIAFDGSSWVPSGGVNSAPPTAAGNCVEIPNTRTGNGVIETACGTAKDLSGKKITEFLPDLCLDGTTTISGCNTEALFPSGSVAYDFTLTRKQDVYELYPSLDWTGYRTSGTSDIYGFIQALKTYPQWNGDGCNTGFMVVSYDETSSPRSTKGKMKWGKNTSETGCNNASITSYSETTDFEIVTIGDKALMKVETPNIYRKLNPGQFTGYMLFGAHTGSTNQSGIWSGFFYPASIKQSIKFTGDYRKGPQVVTPVLLNSVLQQRGVTAYPYPTN